LPDGTKTFGTTINNDPEKFYTPEVMILLDDSASQEFKYGNKKIHEIEEEDVEEVVND
jgi:hypothetical protein